uniref:Protein krueppel n=1 Tax=Anopheles atroparvus TaxID=41427 RepID=A0AAG5D9E3_ANOAO
MRGEYAMEICRVCMDEVENYSSIFDGLDVMKKELTPATLISEFCGISIRPNDGLPELVCSSCLRSIVQAYSIREKCIASDRKLRKILFFRNPATHLNEAKAKTNETGKQATPAETVTDGIEETLKIESDVDRSNDQTISEKDIGDGADHFDLALMPIPSPLIICEEDYEEQDAGEPDDAEIKKEPEEGKGSYVDEEFLMEDVPEPSKQNNDSVPYENTTLVDNKTIAMEVEIVKPPQRIRDEDDEENVGNANDLGTKKFVCNLCNQEFSTKGNLKSHTKLHNNERPYCCDECGREFSKKSNYKIHLIRHSNDRTHPCMMCDMSFVCHINLKNHMKKHTGERPHVCQYCNKRFMHLSDLKRHRYLHTGNYPFICEMCGKQFNRQSLLRMHLQSKCPVKHGYKRKGYNISNT